MMRAMFSAISGMQAHQTMLDVTANDIANVNTVGFKGESATFQDALSQLQRGASKPSTTVGGTNAEQIGLGVALGSIQNVMEPGAIQQTGKPLDMAIQGEGWFVVGPSSAITTDKGYSYTRAGNFTLDQNGDLVTQDGDYVIGYKVPHATPPTAADETKINIPSGSSSLTIGTDGTVTYMDSTGTLQTAGQISMVKFANQNGLQRVSNNKFQATLNSGAVARGVPGDTATGMGALAVGSVEMSNVDLAREFTTMITAQRGYEANSRVISVADQVLQNLVNLGRS